MSCNDGKPWVEKASEAARRPVAMCQSDKGSLQLDQRFLQAEFEKAKAALVTDKQVDEEKAFAELRHLEAEMTNAFKELVAARRVFRDALKELNQKYLLLGFDPVKIEVE